MGKQMIGDEEKRPFDDYARKQNECERPRIQLRNNDSRTITQKRNRLYFVSFLMSAILLMIFIVLAANKMLNK